MESSLTLRELNNLIKTTIECQFDSPLWVIAEINNINEHRSGHCYLELVQKSEEQDTIVAQARATIWNTKYRFISSYFEAITGQKFTKGIKILVKVSVDYHELYGLSLNIRDIDPGYTLGDLAKRRKEIIERLQSEGVFDMNKAIAIPLAIQRIAVISSASAAGFEDFVKQLSSNKYGYVFNVSLFEADMQGTNTEKTIINALNKIFERHDDFDIVAIIRGGGSKSDLSFFDNYNIAFYITQFPLPVFSGIGHERDESVTDMVSHTRLKTPTAVANFIIDNNLKLENAIDSNYNYLLNIAKDIIKTQELYITGLSVDILKTKDILSRSVDKCNIMHYSLQNILKNRLFSENYKLENFERTISKSSVYLLYEKEQELNRKIINLKNVARKYVEKEISQIELVEQKVKLLNPKSILKKGYSISLINGKTIKSKYIVRSGDTIETILYEGKIISKVIDNENNE